MYRIDYKGWPMVFVIAVCLIVMIMLYFEIGTVRTWYSFLLVGVMLFILLYLASALLLMPYDISIEGDKLYRTTPVWTWVISLSDVKAVTPIDSYFDLGKCKLGSYGLLGFWGKWHSAKFGDYTAFYGRPDQCFFVRLKNGKGYMLGCKENEALMQAIKDAIAEQ